ncbi:MAG: tetratricopeptide repeat protein [Oscillospiraceae bacterium]|nr:tetratricopeptide repeat protein [Oscillospiraceae bacterium]
MGRLDEAEVLYKEALDIRERLAAENPDVFGEDLEQTRVSLTTLRP